jgi:hypothetical protein
VRSGLHPRIVVLVAACAAALSIAGCSRPSGDDRIESLRSQYDVRLTSFAVDDQPAPPEAAAEAETGATEAPDGEPGGEALEAPVPTRTQVVLDILVTTEADEGLPGLSVELEQVGADGAVKMERTLWLDVSRVVRGSGQQITQVVEDVDYQEGDAFAVSIRSPVPPGERAAYPEFGAAAPGTPES